MLPGMYRAALLGLLIACGNGSKEQKPASVKEPGDTKVPVPGAGLPEGNPPPTVGGADDPSKLSPATKERAKDPKFNLQPSEGTLTIGKVDGKPGAPGTAEIKLAPGKGYHVATDYPIKIWLEAPEGVKLEKTFLTAGGRSKVQGDAATLTEQGLAFAVKATPDKPGTFEIEGVFSFGICEQDSCHPRTQPIKIQVAAK
jgi:hypothetical protein